MSKAKTKLEVVEEFLQTIHGIQLYWENESRSPTEKEKMEGCIFSILAMIDGNNMHIPAMNISMQPHPSDKEFHKSRGENWFKAGQVINGDVSLHNEWQRLLKAYEDKKNSHD